MKQRIAAFGMALMLLPAFTIESHAGWKIRGWYAPQVVCKMKKVTIRKDGKVKVQVIRVCN